MKESLHNLKLKIEDLYFNNNKIVLAITRFIFALFIFGYINFTLGAFHLLKNPIITVALSVLAIFLPLPLTMIIAFIVIGLHLFKLSIILLIGYVVLLAVMYLLVFRICSDKWIVVFASIILFWIKLPYLIPLLLGIVFSTSIFIPATLATGFALFLEIAAKYKVGTETESISAISATFTNIAKDGYIIMWVLAVAISVLVVSIVKTFNMKNCKEIAIVLGGIVEMIILVAAKFILKVDVNIAIMILLNILSIVIALAFLWAMYPFNYKSTEYVEFFDDEYYYFVRAVPLSTSKRNELLNNSDVKVEKNKKE